MNRDKIKSFQEQFCECSDLGFHKETEFKSFEEHPELLPAPFNKKINEAIKSGEMKGIDFTVCGRFGGHCSSGNEQCKKLRGYQ